MAGGGVSGLWAKLNLGRFWWSPHDMGHLGLGTVLYLNFMRYMALIYLFIGIFSIPNAYINRQGDRWLSLEATDYSAVGTSLGNLGSSRWTPLGDNYCNNRGFMAEICEIEGWGSADSVYSYECGAAPKNVSSDITIGNLVGLGKRCTKKSFQCKCMPGFTGSRCETDSRANTAAIPGWCIPNKAWWAESNPVRPSREDRKARTPAMCNGRGWCEARVSDTNLTNVRYTFCQCDDGWWGDQCQNSDAPAGAALYKHGEFYNSGLNEEYSRFCGEGVAAEINREFIAVRFPPATCKTHGWPDRMSTTGPFRRLTLSSPFRPQTPGICWCEPGFNGEQCLGGQPVPDMQGWFAGVCTFILLFGMAFLYRQRKWMEQEFDDAHVTPSDFSVFVDRLPTMTISQAGEIQKHFEQWGPVQSVTPGTDDEILVWCQKDKNQVLETLQMYRELDHNRRAVEQWSRTGKQGPKPAPSALPPLTNLVDEEAEERHVSGLDSALFLLCWNTGFAPVLLSRDLLFKYLLWLNQLIAFEMKKPEVEEFHRCFVTFQLSSSQDECVDDYSDDKEGIFGKPHEQPAKCLFRGKSIHVKAAAEPEEVMWDSLDTGKREMLMRRSWSFFVMLGVIVGLFALVIQINADPALQDGVAAVLINLALVVINMGVAMFWQFMGDVEQHYTYGSKMRSVYIKTLLTQLTVTVLAGTLGVYGYPFDSKNGYISDWYAEAGGFLFRQVILEACIPVAINFANMPARGLQIYAYFFGTSAMLNEVYNRPAPYIMAERCASLMRTILLCSAFNCGLPILNFAVVLLISTRYWADKYCIQHNFRVNKSGPELARVLELTLMLAVIINAVVSWVTLRAGWQTSFISEVVFYIAVIALLWAILGYFSYRWFRGRDCWCGSGPILPCSGWLCCFNQNIMRPLNKVHEAYMRFVFGPMFFDGDFEDENDETAGQTYDQLWASGDHYLRRYPYVMYERAQLFPQVYMHDPEPMENPMTGIQYKKHIVKALSSRNMLAAECGISPAVTKQSGGSDGATIVNPMHAAGGSKGLTVSLPARGAGGSTDSTPMGEASTAGAKW